MTFVSLTVRPFGYSGLGTPSSTVPIAVATSSPWKSKTEIRVLESSSTYLANHLRGRARRQRSIRTNRNLANARAVASGGGGLPTTVTLATAPYGSVASAPSLAPTQPPAPSAQTPVSSQADRPGYLGNIARVSGHWVASYQSGIATLHTTQHVQQEYARHAGHLDIACEILAGVTGE